ncbi:MAG: filamentous hemagglutinin N-terminal domain-containing protein [Leptolyngbyaceae cyanobacterium RU_5_1]|nr:filamentous hemagglutinin N-terminal domain-containing protein [Leptolyngbyaceae cyanobacterium RU_5_1]
MGESRLKSGECRLLIESQVLVGAIASLVAIAAGTTPALTQIIPDATLPINSTVAPGCTDCTIDGGTVRGTNLFHSFREFSVPTGGAARFNNAIDIQNILTRVTGNSISTIDGLIQTNGSANLFFLNPNGIVFGSNARLDIRGSFVASTAQGVLFENGFNYSATNPQAPPLLTVNVPLGLQMGAGSEATMIVAGNLVVGNNLTLAAANLDVQGQVQAGNNLTLEAQNRLQVRDTSTQPAIAAATGNLLVQGDSVDILALNHPDSGLFAGGDLVLKSANSVSGDAHFWSGGQFRVETLNGALGNLISIHDPIIRANGDVFLAGYQGASLHILAGGSVTIPGDVIVGFRDNTGNAIAETLSLSDGSLLRINGNLEPTVDIRAGIAWQPPPGNRVAGGLPVQPVFAAPTSANITIGRIAAFNLQQNGVPSRVFLSNQYQPNRSLTGDISVSVIDARNAINGGAVTIDSRNNIAVQTAIDTSVFRAGNGGDVTLLAQTNIRTPAGGIISSGLLAGNITLTSGGTILMSGGEISTANLFNVPGNPKTSGGNITLIAQELQMTQGGLIATIADNNASGGKISITANRISMDGFQTVSNQPFAGGLLSLVANGASGNGGDITITTDNLAIANGSEIISSTRGSGKGGDITIHASDAITLVGSGFNQFSDPTASISSTVQSADRAIGGTITLKTRSLSLQNGAQLGSIASSSNPASRGGNVNITGELVSLDGIGSIIGSDTSQGSRASGGDIFLTTQRLSVTNGGRFSSDVNPGAEGNGGNITVVANDILFDAGNTALTVGGVTGATSQVGGQGRQSVQSALPLARGRGGNLTFITQTFSILNGARVSTEVLEAGLGGDIAITATEGLVVSGTGQDGAAGGVFTRVSATAQSNGGNLTVSARNLTIANGAQLNSDTQGKGNAGNIRLNIANTVDLFGRGSGVLATTTSGSTGNGGTIVLNPERITIRDRARISVDSQGSGEGGNIQVQTNSLNLDTNAAISAQTASNTGGNIDLTVQDILLLRRGSIISTTAGTAQGAGDGGNIAINAGFIVAIPSENSDITANAFTGRGGNIAIATQAIFGIAFRPRLTPFSDITASSEFGLAGSVNITTLGIDPVQRAANLSETFSTPPLAQGCRAPGSQRGSFVNTGRGGVPSSPVDPIAADTIWQDLEPILGRTEGGGRRTEDTPDSSLIPHPSSLQPSPHPTPHTPIIEAQGWIVLPDGAIALVADPSVALPHPVGEGRVICR